MSLVKVDLQLFLNIPENEKVNQDLVFQELLDKLYVHVDHYQSDVFSVLDLNIKSFEVQ